MTREQAFPWWTDSVTLLGLALWTWRAGPSVPYLHLVISKCLWTKKASSLSFPPGWQGTLWPSGAVGGHVVPHVLGTPWSPDYPRTALCAHQAPHTLLLAPQPRRPVWTVTSPVTTATASPSGGSVMARRSAPTAPMSPRPLAVSPAPLAGGGGLPWALVSSSDLPWGEVGRFK